RLLVLVALDDGAVLEPQGIFETDGLSRLDHAVLLCGSRVRPPASARSGSIGMTLRRSMSRSPADVPAGGRPAEGGMADRRPAASSEVEWVAARGRAISRTKRLSDSRQDTSRGRGAANEPP